MQPTWVGRDLDSWGIDHGTWSVLVHAFPDAAIPVVQLSLNAEKPLDYHLALGQKLTALRREGVLVVGSGNIVHNLRAVDFALPDSGVRLGAAFRRPCPRDPAEPTGRRHIARRRPRLPAGRAHA